MKSALQSIIKKQRDSRFWQYSFLAAVVIFTAIIAFRELSPRTQGDILIIGKDGYYRGKLQKFPDALELHKGQAQLATLFLLQRSPSGRDYQKRLGKLFSTQAFKKARNLAEAERHEFELKSLHQKVEIAQIKILRVRGNAVLAHVTGQLIRAGNFEGKPFIEALKFKLGIEFTRNPNIADTNAYPSIVTNFNITTNSVNK